MSYRVDVKFRKDLFSKTFTTEEEAKEWADMVINYGVFSIKVSPSSEPQLPHAKWETRND